MEEFIQESAVPHVNRMEEIKLGLEPVDDPVWDGRCSMCDINIDTEETSENEAHYERYGNYCVFCDGLCEKLARWRINENDSKNIITTPDEFSQDLDKRRKEVANGLEE